MAVRIVTDSTVDIAEQYRNDFTVVPLTVSFGETVYIDGVTLNKQDFYQKLVSSAELPKTSQATPDTFGKVFRELQEKGEEAVVITVSSRLSGTYQSARIAAEDYPNIRVVDSMNVSIASGVLAEYALRCASDGMGLDELAQHLTQKRDEIGLVAMVDTLEYLKKGGRISAATALAGSLLSIKPVITLEDGKVVMAGKARGSRQGNTLLREMIQKCGGINFSKPFALAYSGLSDALLQKYISDCAELWQGQAQELPVTTVGCAIGTHVGPGAIAIAFFQK